MPNLIAGSLAAYLPARDEYLAARAGAPPELLGGEPYLEASAPSAFALVVTIDAPMPYRWEAIVVLAGDAARPYLVRAWRRPLGRAP